MSTAGDLGITIRRVSEEFGKLKAAYEAKNNTQCLTHLRNIRRDIIHFPSFLAPDATSATKLQEVMLTREYLEIGALVSIREKDLDGFESHFEQLRVYYTDAASVTGVQASERYHLLMGLHLMTLLVRSKIAQLHSELEMIPVDEHRNMFLRFPIGLERYMMEGSYNKLLHARSQVPSNEYLPIVEMLEDTVRHEVAACIPRTYNTISVAQARKLLMVSSDAQVQDMGKKNGWHMNEAGTHFVFDADDGAAKRELPFKEMLQSDIRFAAELQRVV